MSNCSIKAARYIGWLVAGLGFSGTVIAAFISMWQLQHAPRSPDPYVERIKLIPSAPATTPLIPEFKRIDRVPTDDPAVSFWILAKPLELVYQDVTMEGELRSSTMKADAIPFSCGLSTSRHGEWRAPWFDALMSI